MPSNFGDFSDPRQLLVEGFLADPMTPFNNPSVIIRDDLGRAVFKLEIKMNIFMALGKKVLGFVDVNLKMQFQK